MTHLQSSARHQVFGNGHQLVREEEIGLVQQEGQVGAEGGVQAVVLRGL